MIAGAPPVDYFAELCRGLRLSPDRKGEVWLPCPQCGKKDRHFSFSERGAQCFVCGYRPPLRKLWEALVGGVVAAPAPRPVAPPVQRMPRPWQGHALQLAESLAATPGAAAAWQRYKPLPADVIHERRLGLGPWPGGLHYKRDGAWQACQHRRLIVPLFSGRDVVGFRCRAIECGCKKWLSPGGTQLVLYGADAVVPGQPLAIVENPVDALLAAARWAQPAVATLGVTIWKESYTDQVRPASTRCIAFDNDDAGRTASVKLANTLLAARLPTWLFDWSGYPAGADIGSLFQC